MKPIILYLYTALDGPRFLIWKYNFIDFEKMEATWNTYIDGGHTRKIEYEDEKWYHIYGTRVPWHVSGTGMEPEEITKAYKKYLQCLDLK